MHNLNLPEHSTYGASSSYRWLNCPASIRMSKGKLEEHSEDAELGTAAHELGEFCLKIGVNAFECIGMVFNEHVVDITMVEAVQLYVSYIRDLCRQYGVDPMLEKRVVMSSVRNDVYGTSDCVVIVGEWMFIIDYKHGYDVVEVKNNSQAIHYAISTMDTLQLWNSVKYIRTAIVQPHSYHIDGAIRTHDYHASELVTWRDRFKNAIAIAESDCKPVAGSWCKRCLAQSNCYARFMRTVELTFMNGELTPESITPLYLELSSVTAHINEVKKMMLSYAKKGGKVENHKLVKVSPSAKCIDVEAFVKDAAFTSGRDESEFYNKKLKSKTDCMRLVAKDEMLINQYFKRPDSESLKLVPMSDSKPAVSLGSAVGVFEPIVQTEQKQPSAVGIFTPII